MRKTVTGEREALEYQAAMLGQLCRMASAGQQEMLGYLLGMAYLEVCEMLGHSPHPGAEARHPGRTRSN
jgi:hypothetical protein